MVEVRIYRDSRGKLGRLQAEGHAGWADAGDDIVCAAVSTLLQAAWLGLAEVAGYEVRAEKSAGRLDLDWPPEARNDAAAAAIVETTARSIEQIARQFPKNVSTKTLAITDS